MKPTLGIVLLFLSEDYDVVADCGPQADSAFDEWRIFDGGDPLPDVLYLVHSPIKAVRDWNGRLVLGLWEPPRDIPAGCHYVQVRERVAKSRSQSEDRRFVRLVNAVQAAVRRFGEWALLTERECGSSANLHELLNICARETGLVSILVDKNLRHLAVSDSFGRYNDWFKPSEPSMDFNMVNELMADEAFRRAIEQREPFFYHYKTKAGEDQASACFNIFIEDSYAARLLVQSSSGRQERGMLAMAKYLGQHLADVLERYQAELAGAQASPEFAEAVSMLLHGAPARIDELRSRLELHGWDMQHRYRVHVFSFMQPESESVTRRYYEGSIARLFPGCCVIPEGDLVCCVRNLTIEGAREATAQQDFVLFLRENLCRAGTSADFYGIAKLSAHYEEARSALRLGVKGASTEWHFRFQDYALEHVLDRATDGVERQALYHPAYLLLQDHDEAHGTKLLETVRCFIACKYNVSHAAARLGIHRSSMLSRLDRIDEIAALDWDDERERLHLALTFALVAQDSAPNR